MIESPLYFFSAKDVADAVPMEEAVGLMKEAFIQLSSGHAFIPQRVGIEIPGSRDGALVMPVYSAAIERLGVKLVSIFHDNEKLGLPTIHALVTIMDATNGRPLAIMDGEYLTALRTGAASGFATDLLARQDSETLAIIGAGAQGRTQLKGVCAVRDIKMCYIYDKNRDTALSFIDDLSSGSKVEFALLENPVDLAEADIICTATTSSKPVFEDANISNGTHINAIGAYTPKMSEVPVETIARSRIAVDQRSACLNEAGDLINAVGAGKITIESLAELGEIASGEIRGRRDESEITLFKSVGNAIQDLVAANRVLENGLRNDLGTRVSL